MLLGFQKMQFQNMVTLLQGATDRVVTRAKASEPSRRPAATMTRTPPTFEGKRPGEWLAQLEFYHNALAVPELDRVTDAVNYLEGPALSHYCLAVDGGTYPKT